MAVSMAPDAPKECPKVDFVAETVAFGLMALIA